MMVLLLALALGELPQQSVAPGRCVLFLWSRTEPPRRVAMVDESAATLRLMLDGKPMDLARIEPGRYAAGPLAATLSADFVDRPGMAPGSAIAEGALRLEQAGEDALVTPVGGLRSCVPAASR
jgi:hypothetical protein